MNAHPLCEDHTLPLLLKAEHNTRADDLTAWLLTHRQAVDDWTHAAGAVLIRGFDIASPTDFRAVCTAIRPELRNYVGGDSPRQSVTDQVYTSTEYPAHLEVLLHNELSYAGWSPERLFFGCLVAAASGGETPIADGRGIYARLNPTIRDRFEAHGVTYLQHLWDAAGEPGVGKSWQQTFESNSHTTVEAYLREAGMTYTWTELGLRTAASHPAVLIHGETGEKCWHNQADQWHRGVASVKDSVADTANATAICETAGTETLGHHATYGDGNEIDVADILHVREVSRACEVVFAWQQGDIMIIDNVLAMHGRKPFIGNRRILAAMA